jgi:hypothetical protein
MTVRPSSTHVSPTTSMIVSPDVAARSAFDMVPPLNERRRQVEVTGSS